ncbi:protein GUCD1-like isoform X1 [Biomphalaria glabrata]|uniref:Protein GUCD1-like isoform X1 n=2 Tax=Biomphalaria glabrata TaxID=6526 RepID=A0A9W2YHX9_BIOGL|nr:protein GUCD1-like isoform X1 [Biomphalaria glabrata]
MNTAQPNFTSLNSLSGGDQKFTLTDSKDKHVISIPFVNQCYTWDCGLACVSMILRMLNEPCDDVYTNDLDSLQCGESIWTIDLAYILTRHNVDSCLYTISVGVDSAHGKKSFYSKNFTVDELRVNAMFENAHQKGVRYEKRVLSIDDLVNHLHKNNPMIVLVDWTLMKCLWCDSRLRKCWSCVTCNKGPYQGHFVVVCGYDTHKDLIFYKNPDSHSHDLCCIHMDDFDRARKSDGTDQDTLYIYSQSSRAEGGEST